MAFHSVDVTNERQHWIPNDFLAFKKCVVLRR